MRHYAEDTSVPIARTRAEIDRLLKDWGCTALQWTDDFESGTVELRFVWRRGDGQYRARVRLTLPTDEAVRKDSVTPYNHRFSEALFKKRLEARGRPEHRVLLLWLKACFNAVESGIVKAEEVFLPFLEGQNGVTVAEFMVPRMQHLLTGSVAGLLGAPKEGQG